tara:strand:- start:309 stop:500 length:192 start_codon:yes stop_codon:yes gene_type:complete
MNLTADTILAKLRDCTTAAEIEAVANHHRAEVIAMRTADPARFHHVVNAKAYYLERLKHAASA